MALSAYFSKETIKGETNPLLLKEQAAAAFGSRYVNNDDGIVASDTRGLGIYLEGDITKEDEAAWDAIILAHDGTGKTAEQQAEDTAQAEKDALIAKVNALPDDDVAKMLAKQMGLID